MEKLHSKKEVHALVAQAGIRQYFSTPDLQFFACRYKKGEIITAPDQKLDTILFVIEGTVRIFGIRPDGTTSPVNQQTPPVILGDIEFSQQGTRPFFTQATTDVLCIGLPVKPYEKELHRDLRFLHALLHSYAEKLQFFAFVDAPAETLEERVLLYLKNFCPNHEFTGIEMAVSRLRCSRRQLQRVLQKLCTNGTIQKVGKGHYKLVGSFSPESQ
ncbi:Crp/Fnr family transcriptional regulator [Subdoligranulum variabile]|uniref:Cyclic nucleotide-binding domain protein n=1 Tax=Subdoligranulum variabile DSM 15176 TaxID=411471 RepID=D1PKF6_9FIRM|nr:Crp/Fnr family transcriptional regulator [Subdoligranulum variabile]EFB76464.1 cyclic nucleotide-binding domain protein [Subdoligranulum variabile DSM 15176]UWP68286.1 Crp/Fnr family transcriptional regulator [Subdoligranulum variabile]